MATKKNPSDLTPMYLNTERGQQLSLERLSWEISAMRDRLSALERSQEDLKALKEVLRQRREFEGLIMGISREFVSLSIHNVDRSIDGALQRIGLFTSADRGYVFLFSGDGKRMDNIHEWCARGIEPRWELLKGVPLDEAFPWFANAIEKSDVLYVPGVAGLPEEAAAEKQEFRLERIRSLIMVPMFCSGSLVGVLGFDFVRQKRTWSEENIAVLRIAGEIFASALVRTKAEEELRQAKEKYHAMFENAVEGIYQTTPEGCFITANPRLAAMLGYRSVEDLISAVTNIGSQAYVNPERRNEYIRLLEEHGSISGFEFEHYRKDGSIIWVSLNARVVRDENGRVLYYEGMVIDITERKRAEETIRHLAYHDSLTGLPNRTLFHDRFTMALAHVQRYRKKMALMILDLDTFKAVNDTFGHSTGDRLLQKIAKRLNAIPRKSDTVARLGGDEFIFLMPEISGREDATKIGQKILYSFRVPFSVDRRRLYVTASIGIAIYPSDGLDEETLMRHADMAMYRAKAQGRNACCLYLPQHPLVSETMFRDA